MNALKSAYSKPAFAVSLVIGALFLGVMGCSGEVDIGAKEDGGAADGESPAMTSNGDAAAFVCVPPADASAPGTTFSGTRFDPTGACLTGSATTLPVCGCFGGVGLDWSTWCFADPNGTAYFAISDDGCDVQIPAGWYATQTSGPSPFGSPTAAQAAACTEVLAASTVTATPDHLGPPACAASSTGSSSTTSTTTGSSSGSNPIPPADAGVCDFDAQTLDVFGAPGYPLEAVQGTPCTGDIACAASIAAGPFCGSEAARLDDYRCECDTGSWACTLVSSGTGVPAQGWCDGGNGTSAPVDAG